jgi:hypothetical protein
MTVARKLSANRLRKRETTFTFYFAFSSQHAQRFNVVVHLVHALQATIGALEAVAKPGQMWRSIDIGRLAWAFARRWR